MIDAAALGPDAARRGAREHVPRRPRGRGGAARGAGRRPPRRRAASTCSSASRCRPISPLRTAERRRAVGARRLVLAGRAGRAAAVGRGAGSGFPRRTAVPSIVNPGYVKRLPTWRRGRGRRTEARTVAPGDAAQERRADGARRARAADRRVRRLGQQQHEPAAPAATSAAGSTAAGSTAAAPAGDIKMWWWGEQEAVGIQKWMDDVMAQLHSRADAARSTRC